MQLFHLSYGHELLRVENDHLNRKSTAYYLDQKNHLIIKKEVSWPKSSQSDLNSPIKGINHPKNPTSLTRENSTILTKIKGSTLNFEYFKLNGLEIEKEKDPIITNLYYKSINNLKYKNPYTLVKSTKSRRKTNTTIDIYYNDKTGKYVLTKGRKRNKEKIKSIALPKENLKTFRSADQSLLRARSPYAMKIAHNEIINAMRRHNISKKTLELTKIELKKHKAKLDKYIAQFEKFEEVIEGDTKKVISYNHLTNEFFYQEYYKENIVEDAIIPMSNELEKEKMIAFFKRKNLFSKKPKEKAYIDSHERECNKSIQDITQSIFKEKELETLSNITDFMWVEYLQNAVSEKPKIKKLGVAELSIKIEDTEHALSVKADESGNIVDLIFQDKELANEKGHLIVKKSDPNGNTYFSIEQYDPATNKNFALAHITLEGVEKRGEKSTGKLSIYLRGKKGQDYFEYDDYEKFIYPIELKDNKISKVGSRNSISLKRTTKYNTDHRKGSKSYFTSFIFYRFFSTEGKKEKISDQISAEMKKIKPDINEDGKEFINDEEIDSTVKRIVESVALRTDNFDKNLSIIKATAYEESYNQFISLILPRVIEDMLPGERAQTYEDITVKAMADMKNCLKNTTEKYNVKEADKCLQTFMREAPIIVGEEVIKLLLKQNELESASTTTINEYKKCVKENYDLEPNQQKAMDFIKGCIYQSFIVAIDKNGETIILESVSKTQKEFNEAGNQIVLTLDKKQIDQAKNKAMLCLKQKGYYDKTEFGRRYNITDFKSLSPDEYKHDLLTCSSLIEAHVGRNIAHQVVNKELSSLELEKDVQSQIVKTVVDPAIDNCLKIQNENIKENNNKKDIASIKNCTDLLTLGTLREVITQKINETVLEDSSDAPYQQCFNELNKTVNNEVLLRLTAKYEPSENIQDRAAKCLKEAIVWSSKKAATVEIANIAKNNKTFEGVNYSPTEIEELSSKVQQCFTKRIETKKTFLDVQDSIDSIKDKCIVELIADKSTSEILITPILKNKLKESGLDDTSVNDLSRKLLSHIQNKIEIVNIIENHTSDQAIEVITKESPKLTLMVIKDQVDRTLVKDDMKGLLSEVDAKALSNDIVDKKLIIDIQRAYEIKDEKEQARNLAHKLSNLKLSATKKVSARVLPRIINDILRPQDEKNTLAKSHKLNHSNKVSKEAKDLMDSCISNKIKSNDRKLQLNSDQFSDDTTICLNKVTSKITSDIVPFLARDIAKKVIGDEHTLSTLDEMIKTDLSSCIKSINLAEENEVYKEKVQTCSVNSIFKFSDSLLRSISSKSEYLISNDDNSFNDCTKKINKSNELNIIIDDLKKCIFVKALPNKLNEYKKGIVLTKDVSLNKDDKEFIENTFDKLQDFSEKSFSNGIWLSLEKPKIARSKLHPQDKPSQVKARKNSNTIEANDTKGNDIAIKLDKIAPHIAKYLRAYRRYNPLSANSDIDNFLNSLNNKIESDKEIKLDELIDFVVDSPLADELIKGAIADIVKEKTTSSLKELGVGVDVINKISSYHMINRIFKGRDGQEAIEKVKNLYLRKLLKGELENAELPKEVLSSVTKSLLNDRSLGGFVETILGGVVQVNLNEKRPGNFFTKSAAGLMGYNWSDFEWSYLRSRREKGKNYKDQPIKKTIDHFADNLLTPMIDNDPAFTKEKENAEKEKLVEYIEGLIEL